MSFVTLAQHSTLRDPPPKKGRATNCPPLNLAARAAKTPQFFTMLAAASGGRMVTNPGGVLVKTAAGDIIGAVGISGDTSDRDEACAIAGIEAAGLKADPGQDARCRGDGACGRNDILSFSTLSGQSKERQAGRPHRITPSAVRGLWAPLPRRDFLQYGPRR